jgi:hypothetical protein
VITNDRQPKPHERETSGNDGTTWDGTDAFLIKIISKASDNEFALRLQGLFHREAGMRIIVCTLF